MQNLFFPLLLMLPFTGNIATADEQQFPPSSLKAKATKDSRCCC